ncbi:lipoate--protein ligase family protein [Pseudomonas sp. CCI3.2]|uniref:lipoate--protein ligase family protein n=1 Tax=unclassified Pseudomonas TaxID=196821 RepID=UPI002AC9B67E|nr:MULTISPECIES: lipoate--protein ligase family protein [unclassified Pseudomonas]MEB0080184.1 lipoate--protein ligase family protein [Pseudomonas sp. MH10out]MEB0094190.1 lipoate--protein ligase family protein [Pseudomonas sp. CCI4.2]MEB0104172.1 lipoate--protein ligase family protein [Pseudomonas sp. CCI3.2]MEB0123404.1 lipoate--protein ligase family protein [Pseudomonas sp. CCI1.2]MEB0133315.1 lipoate--protein ligase family protein [Pseudomonas sp. CCI2.4]
MNNPVIPTTVAEGLKAEQDLLASVCAGEAEFGLLFWRPTDRALVMPRRMSRLVGFDAATEALADLGWPILLRESGGEPVPQSHATVNIALVYAQPRGDNDRDRIENAYVRLCQPICDELIALGGAASVGEVEGAFCDGRFNVNLDGRKMVGTAQRWRQSQGGQRPVVLAHGALLLDNEREDMVAAVNVFNQICEQPQRVRAESHIALHEAFPAADVLEQLAGRYQRMLDEF